MARASAPPPPFLSPASIACVPSSPQVLRLYNKLLQFGLRPTLATYTTVINACLKAGSADKAMEFYNAMKAQGIKPDFVLDGETMTALRPRQQERAASVEAEGQDEAEEEGEMGVDEEEGE